MLLDHEIPENFSSIRHYFGVFSDNQLHDDLRRPAFIGEPELARYLSNVHALGALGEHQFQCREDLLPQSDIFFRVGNVPIVKRRGAGSIGWLLVGHVCPSRPSIIGTAGRYPAELHALFGDARVLIGYNVAFDLDMLQAEFARAGLPPLDVAGKLIVDPYRLWGAMEPRGLQYAHRRFVGSDFDGAHRAGADVAATAAVLCGMLAAFGLQPEWYSLAELCRGRRG